MSKHDSTPKFPDSYLGNNSLDYDSSIWMERNQKKVSRFGMSDKNSILICDDEPDIVSLVQKFLQLDNYNTLTCSNGKEALKVLEEKYDEILVILLDIMMPALSGFEVLRTIRTKDSYNDIKVILFTVKSFKEDIEKGKELGADGYVSKPFSGNELRDYVKEIINN